MKKKSLFSVLLFSILTLTACSEEPVDVNTLVKTNQETIDQFDSENIYEGQMSLGEKDAPIKIVEFGDYECPHCKAWDGSMFDKIKKDYIDTGKAQFYFINYTILGEESQLIAMTVETVASQDTEQAWKLHHAFFDNQATSFTSTSIVDFVKKHTKGLDYDKLQQDIEKGTYLKNIQDDYQIAANLELAGTPSIFINGVSIPDGHTYKYNTYKDIIDGLLTTKEDVAADETK